jgi:hypothetical protein
LIAVHILDSPFDLNLPQGGIMKSINFLGEKTKAFFTSDDGHTRPQQVFSVAAMLGAAAVAEFTINEFAHGNNLCPVEILNHQCDMELGQNQIPCGDGSVLWQKNLPTPHGGDMPANWAAYLMSLEHFLDASMCASNCGGSLDTDCDQPNGLEIFCCMN